MPPIYLTHSFLISLSLDVQDPNWFDCLSTSFCFVLLFPVGLLYKMFSSDTKSFIFGTCHMSISDRITSILVNAQCSLQTKCWVILFYCFLSVFELILLVIILIYDNNLLSSNHVLFILAQAHVRFFVSELPDDFWSTTRPDTMHCIFCFVLRFELLWTRRRRANQRDSTGD